MPSNIKAKTDPPAYAPVYNKIELCYDETGFSTNGKVNYKYIFTVTVENTIDTYTQKFYVPPVPDSLGDGLGSQFGIIDISRYLDSYLKERYPNPLDGNSVNGMLKGKRDFIVEYSVNVKSGWDVAGVFTEDPDATGGTNSGTLYAWSGAFEFHDWINQMNQVNPFQTWLCNITGGTGRKFLTNQPQSGRVSSLTETGWTYYMTDTLTDIDQYEIKTYSELDKGGSLVGTFVVDYTDGQTEIEERVARIASAPVSLNKIPGVQVSTGAQPIIPSTGVKSYTVQLQNSAGTAASETLVFNIKAECRYTTYRIHFMNALGGFDFYNFTSYSKVTSSGTRKSYESQTPDINSNGLLYYHATNGKSDYIVKYRDKIKLKSDYLTNEEQEWLKELIYSPLVYLEFIPDEDPDLKQVRVLTTNWRKLTTEHDKLFQLEIEIEEAHQNIRQRK